MDGRRTDGRTPDHGHPISSPCEPNGSGELKIVMVPIFLFKIGNKMTLQQVTMKRMHNNNKIKTGLC